MESTFPKRLASLVDVEKRLKPLLFVDAVEFPLVILLFTQIPIVSREDGRRMVDVLTVPTIFRSSPVFRLTLFEGGGIRVEGRDRKALLKVVEDEDAVDTVDDDNDDVETGMVRRFIPLCMVY